MRFGLSWDVESDELSDRTRIYILSEIGAADGMGFDSAWVQEPHEGEAGCPAPEVFLAFVSRRTSSIQLGVSRRRLAEANPVKVAEDFAVLDMFSRGRAAISVASPRVDGSDCQAVIERIDFLLSAWTFDEFRYRGGSLRFPAHTPDEAPMGATRPSKGATHQPQWEWGPTTPDFLAITPKPYTRRPPLWVEVDDPAILAWAATAGVPPFVGADVPTEEAVAVLERYQSAAKAAGRSGWTSEPVIERRIQFDGEADGVSIGGSARELVGQLRDLRDATGVTHLIWRRTPEQRGKVNELTMLASEVQPLCQV